MADAGADILVAHMGLTTKGSIGAKNRRSHLRDAAKRVASHSRCCEGCEPRDFSLFATAAPIAEPEDATYVSGKYHGAFVGFYGASSAERLPNGNERFTAQN